MRVFVSPRTGVERLLQDPYPESLAITRDPDTLWVGGRELNKDQVIEFVQHLNAWVDSGSMILIPDTTEATP